MTELKKYHCPLCNNIFHLAKCPFCGSEAEIEISHDNEKLTAKIKCKYCDAKIERLGNAALYNAIESWNDRLESNHGTT